MNQKQIPTSNSKEDIKAREKNNYQFLPRMEKKQPVSAII